MKKSLKFLQTQLSLNCYHLHILSATDVIRTLNRLHAFKLCMLCSTLYNLLPFLIYDSLHFMFPLLFCAGSYGRQLVWVTSLLECRGAVKSDSPTLHVHN